MRLRSRQSADIPTPQETACALAMAYKNRLPEKRESRVSDSSGFPFSRE